MRAATALLDDGQGPDLRLAPAAGAAWLAAGWGVGTSSATTLACGAGCLVAALMVLVRGRGGVRDGGVPAQVCLALLAAGLVLLSASAQMAVRTSGVVSDLVERGAAVTLTAVVRSDPHAVRPDPASRFPSDEPRFTVRLLADEVTGRGVTGQARAPLLVIGGPAWADVRPGQRVQARGRLAPADPGDDVVALLLPSSGPTGTDAPGPVQHYAEGLRSGLRAATDPLPPDSQGLLPGLVVGDTSRLPPDLEQAMQLVGLTHLTAVSGSNVAIVCGTVLLVVASCGAGRRLRVGLAALALAGFVVLARPDPSVLRAAVMGGVGLLGLVSARRGHGLPALAAAVVVLTAVDPWLGRAYGFALSVLATAGLLLLARPWAQALARVLPGPVAQAVAVPAAAQAVCAPVVVLLSPQLSLVAVPANMLVAPAVAPATVLGVVATVVMPWWSSGAEALAWLGGWCTWWIAVVARGAAEVPGASVPWPEGRAGALLLAGLTVVAVAILPLVVRGLGRGLRGVSDLRLQRRALVAWLGAACLVAAVLVWPGSPVALRPAAGWPPDGWSVVACDVGQGDAMVVRTGERTAVVVDTGPDPGAVDGCLRRLSVDTVELLVLTHFHADHVDGLAGVLRGRRVARALVSPLAEPARHAEEATAALRDAGIGVEPATAGFAGTAGTLAWRVLWPSVGGLALDAGGGDQQDGANDASVVVRFDLPGLSLLTTGDVEPAAQAPLRRQVASEGSGPVDVLKVAHHGSARQDAALHGLLAPRVALVSSGAGNDYGHPAPATLELLAATGALVARTDMLGDIAVGGDAAVDGVGGLWVAGRRADPPSPPDAQAAPASWCGVSRCRSDVAGSSRGRRTEDAQLAQGDAGAGRAGHGAGGVPRRPRHRARAPAGSQGARGP